MLSLKASYLFNWLRCQYDPHHCPLCIPYGLNIPSTNGELGPVEDWVTENNFKHLSLADLSRIRGCVWYISIHPPSFWTCSQSCHVVKTELYLQSAGKKSVSHLGGLICPWQVLSLLPKDNPLKLPNLAGCSWVRIFPVQLTLVPCEKALRSRAAVENLWCCPCLMLYSLLPLYTSPSEGHCQEYNLPHEWGCLEEVLRRKKTLALAGQWIWIGTG